MSAFIASPDFNVVIEVHDRSVTTVTTWVQVSMTQGRTTSISAGAGLDTALIINWSAVRSATVEPRNDAPGLDVWQLMLDDQTTTIV